MALLLGAVLCLHGIWWGWAETWHPDQMAFHQLVARQHRWPLEPGGFLRPPFHTYFNFFLSVAPVKVADRALEAATGRAWHLDVLSVWWSKLLQIALFLGTVYLVWLCTRRVAGPRSATVVALLLATSAGYVVQSHFLTADVPVVFWMVLSFYFAQRIPTEQKTADYVLAGLLVGVATATKYNGLGAGIAIPVFHLFATLPGGAKKVLFSPRLVLGIGMIAVGFVVANPYAVLSFGRFAEDFIYTNATVPVYDGSVAGETSYGEVLPRIAEIIGWPVTLLALSSLAWAAVRRGPVGDRPARASAVAALAVAAFHIAKFGAFPHLQTRFLLPVVPFLLIAAGICWQTGRRPWLIRLQTGTVVALVAYNLLSSYWVGRRFAEDPRMQALDWVAHTVRPGSTVESSTYTPNWNAYPGIRVDNRPMPLVSGRTRFFAELFKGQDHILTIVRTKELDRDLRWYTADALAQRRPDYLALNSMYYERFLVGPLVNLYPEMNQHMSRLLRGELGYDIAFDCVAKPSPRWLYPEEIEYVDSRLVILRRRDPHPVPAQLR